MLAIPNAISFLFLLAAIFFARKKMIKAHKTMVFFCMLISFYLVYLFADMRLQGDTLISKDRMAVFSTSFKLFLASHIVAATVTFILSLIVCTLGLKEVRKKWHKKVAYTMLPIWAYSAITGVVVFMMVGSPNDKLEPDISTFYGFEEPIDMGSFKLQTSGDQFFTDNDLQGKWTFLSIGYTHCPDICPLSLSNMAQIHKKLVSLKKEELPFQSLFLTADPARDTIEILEKYLQHFNEDFIPLRSNQSLEKEISQTLGGDIVLEEPDAENSTRYSVFHPSGLYLVAPNKKVLGYFRYPLQVKPIVNEFLKIGENF